MDLNGYYRELGLSESASESAIKQAYKSLAKKHHPDHNPGDADAERRFKAVSEAYREILNFRRGASYRPSSGNDDQDAGQRSPSADGRRRSGKRDQTVLHFRHELFVTPREARFGTVKKLTSIYMAECFSCGGYGYRGEKTIRRRCSYCAGTGQRKTALIYNVAIPPKTAEGSVYRFSAVNAEKIAKSPDLYVFVKIRASWKLGLPEIFGFRLGIFGLVHIVLGFLFAFLSWFPIWKGYPAYVGVLDYPLQDMVGPLEKIRGGVHHLGYLITAKLFGYNIDWSAIKGISPEKMQVMERVHWLVYIFGGISGLFLVTNIRSLAAWVLALVIVAYMALFYTNAHLVLVFSGGVIFTLFAAGVMIFISATKRKVSLLSVFFSSLAFYFLLQEAVFNSLVARAKPIDAVPMMYRSMDVFKISEILGANPATVGGVLIFFCIVTATAPLILAGWLEKHNRLDMKE